MSRFNTLMSDEPKWFKRSNSYPSVQTSLYDKPTSFFVEFSPTESYFVSNNDLMGTLYLIENYVNYFCEPEDNSDV